MKGHLIVVALITISSVLPPFVITQTQSPANEQSSNTAVYSRSGRHSIELSMGLLTKGRSSGTITTDGVLSKSNATKVLGGFTYSYWLNENIAVTAAGGVLSTNASISVVGMAATLESATLIPLLCGVKYQPFTFTVNERLRPFVSVAIGPYIGTVSHARTRSTVVLESYTETAVGGRVACGIDFAAARWLQLGLGIGYHLVDDFPKPVGGATNYSGPDFTISIGTLL